MPGAKRGKGKKAKRIKELSPVRLGNCMRLFHPPHPNPLPPKRGERGLKEHRLEACATKV